MWSPSISGVLPASVWDPESESQVDVVFAAWHFTAGSGHSLVQEGGVGRGGLQRSIEAAGCRWLDM